MPNFDWDSLLQAAGDAGKEFEPLPDGPQNLVISKTEVGESKTGKKSIGITAIVESGPYAKRRIWHTWYISPESPNALGRFFREMNLFGLDSNFWAGKPGDDAIIAGLNNKRFVGNLKTSEWQGKKKNEIDSFAAPVGASLGNAAATLQQGGGNPAGGPGGPAASPAASSPAPAAAQPGPQAAPPAAPMPAPQAAPAPAAATPPPAAHQSPWEDATTQAPPATVVTATPPPVPNIPGA